jgi:hypothetical protein
VKEIMKRNWDVRRMQSIQDILNSENNPIIETGATISRKASDYLNPVIQIPMVGLN